MFLKQSNIGFLMKQPPLSLIDTWKGLNIPWEEKVNMIARWGAANSGLPEHIRSASVAMILCRYDKVTAELRKASEIIEINQLQSP